MHADMRRQSHAAQASTRGDEPEELLERGGRRGRDARLGAEPAEGGLAAVGLLRLLQQRQRGQDVGHVVEAADLGLQARGVARAALRVCAGQAPRIARRVMMVCVPGKCALDAGG